MYLKCKELSRADTERPLRLQTMDGRELGPIPFAYNVKFSINYTDLSEIEFTVPRMSDGLINPLYSSVTGQKMVYTDTMGIYILQSPKRDGDGFAETKTVKGYSMEFLFGWKTLFLEEGTYNFWDPTNPSDSVLGRVLELDPSWSPGYVTPRLIGCYRTFDQYNNNALDFCYGDAMEKYRCAIVFDVYKKTISAYDAEEDRGSLPIYLSFDNLLSTVGVEEIDDELTTKLRPYGSDDLSIRSVNPTGSDYLVNLDYFIQNGDLDTVIDGKNLADSVLAWNHEIELNRSYYAAVVASRYSTTALRLSLEADLEDLNGELDTLTAKQSVTIQAYSMEKDDAGRANRQAELDQINDDINSKHEEIASKYAEIQGVQDDLDYFEREIKEITGRLSYEAFFSDEEREVLCPYLIEGEISEGTFVASDLDTSNSAVTGPVSGIVKVSESKLTSVYLEDRKKTILSVNGGRLSVSAAGIDGEIVKGTLDMKDSGDYVLTVTMGLLRYQEHNFPRGMLTMRGTVDDFHWNVKQVTENEITENKGTWFDFETAQSESYFTVGMTEFDQYSVGMELYEFGQECLKDLAWPTYEFSVNSANFLYHDKFAPFRDVMELGKSVHLNLDGDGVIDAKLIGFTLDMEDFSNFSLVFSNRYKLRNQIEALRDEVSSASRATRSFDAGKYIYNRTADKTTQVGQYMDDLRNGAAEAILASKNQSVTVNGTGIHIGGDSNVQLRLTDSMIAMTDDNWQTAKVGIGRFASPETGEVFGINAELLAGNLIIGKNMILQNPLLDENNHPTGTMMFKVDATGAWLYNSRIVLQNDGGVIAIDPSYGVVAGTKLLFDSNGTTITPEFMDAAGELTFDKDGMPVNANFFLDGRTGDAYFRGKVYATSGEFDGTVKARDFYLSDGTSMKSVLTEKGKISSDWLDLYGIHVLNKAGDTVMTIDENGLRFGTGYLPIISQFSISAYGPWHDDMEDGDKFRRDSTDGGDSWNKAYQFRGEDGRNGVDGSDASVTFNNMLAALQIAQGIKKTFITADSAGAPTIYGAKIYGAEIYAGGVNDEGGKIISLTSNGIDLYNGHGYHFLQISGDSYGNATISGVDNNVRIAGQNFAVGTNSMTFASGCVVDFGNADVRNLYATFA